MRIFFVIALALPLLADDVSKERLSAAHTERFNLPAAGTIRLENSIGDVDIEGWERPEVEVTVERWIEPLFDPKDRAEAQRSWVKQDGNDVVISTAYLPGKGVHPLSRRIGISYRIRAPRASKLIVNHNSGGVNVSDISGDIHATVVSGQITVGLAAGGQYAIDSQCKIGDVYSDFEGHYQRKHLLGKEFGRQSNGPSTNLFLRVRFGDIVILKMHGPLAD
jgi:hypothetical protein